MHTDGGAHWIPAAGSLSRAKIGALAAVTLEGRVTFYAGTAGGMTAGAARHVAAQRGLDSAEANETWLNAGVYRQTLRLPTVFVYLPLLKR